MAARDYLRRFWPYFAIAGMVVILLGASAFILETLPPRTIVMATGPEGGAYFEVGKLYRAALGDDVEVRLVPTAGSLESLALLLDPHSGVSVALIQGGTVGAGDTSELESLGTLFYEPLWWFHRNEVREVGVAGLLGRKISIGAEGSGTRALALELIKRIGIEGQVSEFLALSPQVAAEKLLAGEIDVAFMIAAWDSAVVQQLLADERIAIASYPRADAYVALYPFLNKVVVPRGVRDLAKDRPPDDVILIAPKASLVVRKDLHPAIQYLLLNAAMQIHSGPSIFQHAGQFPAAEAVGIPLSNEALRFYKSGPPFLHNYFPFWMAALIGKLIVLIPILAVLYPIMKSLPHLYDWVMRSKILRMYGELSLLEDEMTDARSTGRDIGEMIARLDRLQGQANHLRIPVAYASMLYDLRDHIDLVRERLAVDPDRRPR
jgi:TRAP-type uncharacterized transport system substrate-binding protein